MAFSDGKDAQERARWLTHNPSRVAVPIKWDQYHRIYYHLAVDNSGTLVWSARPDAAGVTVPTWDLLHTTRYGFFA